MTTEDFKDRFKEQIADIKYNKILTTLSNLNQKQDIDIDFNKANTP